MNYITQQNLGGGGRLGNQLFGIACVLGYAKTHNLSPIFAPWKYSEYFENHLIYSDNINPTHHYHEPYFHYTPIDFANSVGGNGNDKVLNLHGYYQSEKYFEHCSRLIRDVFRPNEKIFLMCAQHFFHWPETCAIHVRRGDYVGNAFYTNLDMSYYGPAIQHIIEHTKTKVFMVFSDDIEFAKSMFINVQDATYLYVFSEGHTDIEDLFLMASCDHIIGSNSSFSWWGDYLNQYSPAKISIFPKKWFGENTVLDTKDLYRKEWITL